MTLMSKVAVVAYNLGGPDKTESIQPFLYNLFNDPNIFGLPGFIRTPLAKLISTTRAPKVAPQYNVMGGGSPIQKNTLAQAEALQKLLNNSLPLEGEGTAKPGERGVKESVQFQNLKDGDSSTPLSQLSLNSLRSLSDSNPLPQGRGETIYKVFTAQRYWHPMADEVVQQVKQCGADRVVLLPLYPQFSTTTTSSFVGVWEEAAVKHNLIAKTQTLCCFPFASGYVTAQADLLKPVLAEAKKFGTPRVLFSAHGLPEQIITQRGDPYTIQVQRSAAAIAAQLNESQLDWMVSYQSRVGPLKWVQPYTIDEIHRAAREKVPLILVPLAFVSEHLETLVELDHEYREVAAHEGIPYYGRVSTVMLSELFIQELHDMVMHVLANDTPGYVSPTGRRICPDHCKACPHGVKR